MTTTKHKPYVILDHDGHIVTMSLGYDDYFSLLKAVYNTFKGDYAVRAAHPNRLLYGGDVVIEDGLYHKAAAYMRAKEEGETMLNAKLKAQHMPDFLKAKGGE